MVERLVANEKVEGSTPFARSNIKIMNDLFYKKCVPCEGSAIPFDISEIHQYQKKVDDWDVIKNDVVVGKVTSAVYSPRLKLNIGIAMVKIESSDIGEELKINNGIKILDSKIVEKPFYDPNKNITKS